MKLEEEERLQRIATCPELKFVHDNDVKSTIIAFNEQEYKIARSVQKNKCKIVLDDVCASSLRNDQQGNEKSEENIVLAVLNACVCRVVEINDEKVVEKEAAHVLNNCIDLVSNDKSLGRVEKDGLVAEIAKEFELFQKEIKVRNTVDAGKFF